MSQISKCPKLRVVLGYWEALGEVSERRYKNLLYYTVAKTFETNILKSMSVILYFQEKIEAGDFL